MELPEGGVTRQLYTKTLREFSNINGKVNDFKLIKTLTTYFYFIHE